MMKLKQLGLLSLSALLLAACQQQVEKVPDGWKKYARKDDPRWIAAIKKDEAYKGQVTDYDYVMPPMSKTRLINEIKSNQVLVQGGDLQLKTGKTLNINSFYISKELTSYWQYYSYLNQIDQYHPKGHDFNNPANNGLYPAKIPYQESKNYCAWLAKETKLPFALPTFKQWLYAATSRGTNWAYPTDNGKLELGENYPATPLENDYRTSIPVTGLPINSLGIHQMMGNGRQWTRTILTRQNQSEYNVYFSSDKAFNNPIVMGRHYGDDLKTLKNINLASVYTRFVGNKDNEDSFFQQTTFRCVINTDQAIS